MGRRARLPRAILTTDGLAITDALLGERWRIGEVELEVCQPRTPCRTFAGWMGERGWGRRFTERAAPGAYLRVRTPGELAADEPITVLERPNHQVTVGLAFRALTLEPELLPMLLKVPNLPAEIEGKLHRRLSSQHTQ